VVEGRLFSQRNFYLNVSHHRLCAQFTEPITDKSITVPTILVFLQEGLGSRAQWRDFPTRLSTLSGLSCLVYERFGYGSSDAHDNPRTTRYLHDEALISLPEVLKQCNIDDAILIGHSDGGSIALIYAAVHGKKIRGVITEAAHVFVEDLTLNGILQAVKQYKTTDLRNRLYQFHRDNTDEMFRAWADTWLASWFRTWNIEEYLPQITCPLLAIQGEEDKYGTKAQVDSIVSLVKGPVEGLMIPNCGHVPHHQARERVLNEMVRFIRPLIQQPEN
jgi:pimeloyl-ACP methyl ester carboxylesterase